MRQGHRSRRLHATAAGALMRALAVNWRALALGVLLLVTHARVASAHLMAPQRGTLNLVDDGGYLVLSLPVSAFTAAGVPADEDGDGGLSLAELRAHAAQLEAAARRGITLTDGGAARPLDGVMMSLAPAHEAPAASARQLVLMGRFALGRPAGAAPRLTLSLHLFGTSAQEQELALTVSRGAQTQLLVLDPAHRTHALLPSPGRRLVQAAELGAHHVLGGLDHLLFLLVVVAGGLRLRQLALILTCFTAGHALTLAATTLAGLQLPSRVVEPAIAATIVGMAAFDWLERARRRRGAATPRHGARRLALVFACALVHGLGLAGALSLAGLDAADQARTLAGFNLGVEAAQLGVATAATALLALLRRLGGPELQWRTTQLACASAIVAGAVWFCQRLSMG